MIRFASDWLPVMECTIPWCPLAADNQGDYNDQKITQCLAGTTREAQYYIVQRGCPQVCSWPVDLIKNNDQVQLNKCLDNRFNNLWEQAQLWMQIQLKSSRSSLGSLWTWQPEARSTRQQPVQARTIKTSSRPSGASQEQGSLELSPRASRA